MATFFIKGKLSALVALATKAAPSDPKWHMKWAETHAMELRGMIYARKQLESRNLKPADFEWEAFKASCTLTRIELHRECIARHYLLAKHFDGSRPLISDKPIFA
jgi:hypothetical protein